MAPVLFFPEDSSPAAAVLTPLMNSQEVTFEQCKQRYARAADAYDTGFGVDRFYGPRECARAAVRHYPWSGVASDGDAPPVLDYGCGTGNVSLLVRQAFAADAGEGASPLVIGYDVCSEMLQRAVDKQACDRYVLDASGRREAVRGLRGKVGVVVSCGVLTGAAAVPVAAVDDVVDALVPGGVLVFNWRNSYKAGVDGGTARSSAYRDRLVELQRKGVVELVADTPFDAFVADVGQADCNVQRLLVWRRLGRAVHKDFNCP